MDSETLGLEEYSLSWNGHIQHVKTAFNRLLRNNDFCDVTLYAEGKKIGAHKVFLSACSKYFDELFKQFKDERPIIVLKGIRFNILRHILTFVYNGETNVEIENLNMFLEAATFLKIDGLSENNIKRKRQNYVSESDSVSTGYKQRKTSFSYMESNTEIRDHHLSDGNQEEHREEHLKITKKGKTFRSSPKLFSFDKDSNINHDAPVYNSPDFSKPPRIGKYPMDTPKTVGEWLSDYEFNSQSDMMENPSSIPEHTEISSLDELPSKGNIETNFNKDIKSETTNELTESDVEEISSFDQNDFANSLDAEIEISDDSDDDKLEKHSEKQLMKKNSDDSDDDKLEKQLMKTPLAYQDEKGLYECKICGNKYVKKDSLKKHFAVHVNNTTCSICGKVLSRKTHLKRHLRIHGISSN